MTRGYENSLREANPEFGNESLMAADLFGKVTIEDPAIRDEINAYGADLEENLTPLMQGKMLKANRDELLLRGYQTVEKLWSDEQAIEPQADLLQDMRLGVQRGLELAPGHEHELKAYPTVGHPLEKLGIKAFFRIDTKGHKPVYLSVEHQTNPREVRGIADVVIDRIPDREKQSKEYDAFTDTNSRRIIGKYRGKIEASKEGSRKTPKGQNRLLGRF